VCVGFDFDRVLFKTDEFKRDIMNRTGLVETDERPYTNGLYDYAKHARLSGADPQNVLETVRRICGNYLYDDVNQVKDIDQKVILTRGRREYQRIKIEESGVLEYFDGYAVFQQQPKDFDGLRLLIDDKQKELDRCPAPGFKLDRSKHRLEDGIKAVPGDLINNNKK
jgi:FMN phosphatase YigB (HAD superfamily)